MGKKRNRSEYSETNNRRVFKLLHIKSENGCCMRCAIRQRQQWYRIIEKDNEWTNTKFPSWKLVSKNKKQWMKKPLKFKTKTSHSRTYTTISW